MAKWRNTFQAGEQHVCSYGVVRESQAVWFLWSWSEGWEETGDRQAQPSVAFRPQTSEDAGAQWAAREGLQGSAIESRGVAAGGWAEEEGSLRMTPGLLAWAVVGLFPEAAPGQAWCGCGVAHLPMDGRHPLGGLWPPHFLPGPERFLGGSSSVLC